MKKKEAKGVWKALSLGLSLLLAVSAAGTDAVFTWQNTITRYMGTTTGSVTGADGDNNFVSDYSSIEDLLAAKRDLCIQIGEEGCVLLKNENDALPINKTDKISLFGRNSTDFVVGLSSGGGKISGDDDLKTVFDSVGVSINETLWNYYTSSEEGKRRSSEQIKIGEIDPASYPSDVKASYSEYSDAAFVVISRNFGEGHDAPTDPAAILDGDGTHYALQLQDKERAVIEEAKKCSDKVIVIINSDNVMEIGELKDDPEIDAILQVGGTGVYGLYGVANVITGETSPSGHLVDTYAYSNFSSPASQNYGDFSFSNYDHTYVVYQEGIYVGYKYYETRYEDAVMGQGNAVSAAGAVNSEGDWNYQQEIVYSWLATARHRHLRLEPVKRPLQSQSIWIISQAMIIPERELTFWITEPIISQSVMDRMKLPIIFWQQKDIRQQTEWMPKEMHRRQLPMSIPEAEKWMHRPVQLLLIQEQKSPISWRA